MKCLIRTTTGVALLAVLTFYASSALAQDPAKVIYRVRLNNARVRVLEVMGKTGQKAPMHSHPDYVTYNISGGKTKFTYPQGQACGGYE